MDYSPKRASRGALAVHSDRRYRDSVSTLGDLLNDLMHLAKRDGIDFEKELEAARRHHAEDCAAQAKKGDLYTFSPHED